MPPLSRKQKPKTGKRKFIDVQPSNSVEDQQVGSQRSIANSKPRQNFQECECVLLLDCIESITPVTTGDWNAVTIAYNKGIHLLVEQGKLLESDIRERDRETLKKKFAKIMNKSTKTGDSKVPELVERALKINDRIPVAVCAGLIGEFASTTEEQNESQSNSGSLQVLVQDNNFDNNFVLPELPAARQEEFNFASPAPRDVSSSNSARRISLNSLESNSTPSTLSKSFSEIATQKKKSEKEFYQGMNQISTAISHSLQSNDDKQLQVFERMHAESERMHAESLRILAENSKLIAESSEKHLKAYQDLVNKFIEKQS
jgi:hypothetical protein